MSKTLPVTPSSKLQRAPGLRIGLRARLLAFLFALVFVILASLSAQLLRRQTRDMRDMMRSKIDLMRQDLRTKGMALARNSALSSQRAVAEMDYLFLDEVINSTVKNDAQIVYGVVMNNDGRALVHSVPRLRGQVLTDATASFAARAIEPAVQDATFEGQQVIEAVAPIFVGDQKWGTIRFGLSLAALNEAIADSERHLAKSLRDSILVSIATAVLLVVIGSVVAGTGVGILVLGPVGALMTGVQRVRDAVLTEPVRVSGSTEFGDLANAFNEMSETIRSRNASLEETNTSLLQEIDQRREAEASLQKAHDELERRVMERTAALSIAKDELAIQADKLKRSNEDLAAFAYVASHDLQEPLRKVRAFGERLQDSQQLNAQGTDFLSRMVAATTRMQALIDALLNYSRLTTKTGELRDWDLNVIARDVLSDLEVAVEKRNAQVLVDPLPTLACDDVQMRQLFQNLIANALKFQKVGTAPVIRIHAEPAELNDKPAVTLTFSDNGIGFDQRFAEKIFGVFQRLHSRSAYEGTGIGLSVCRKLVQRHGGQIVAKSEVGVGTTFFVTLPAGTQSGEAHAA